jgi:hypothetical protein
MIKDENIEFYEQEYVKKIIDVHFPLTKKFYCVLLIFYLSFFFMPLVATIFSGCGASKEFLTTMYCMQSIAQLSFFSIEMLQLRYLGIDYFKEFFNVFEISQFLLFLTFISIKLPQLMYEE